MVSDVDEPRSPLTDSEKSDITVNCNYHELGMTRTGGTPLVKMGSMWSLLNEDGERKGDGYHSIDEFKIINGAQYYVAKSGAMIYIVDEDGHKVSDGHHSVRHLGGNKFEGKTGASEERFSINV